MQRGKHQLPFLSVLKRALLSNHQILSSSRFLFSHQGLTNSRVWLTSLGVAGCVIALRSAGFLQTWELAALDQFFCVRPREPADQRLVIVGINESDLHQAKTWPISDAVMAKLLTKIQSHNPRAVGLDIYRDLPVEPGHADLKRAYQSMPNLIGIEQIQDIARANAGVPASPDLAQRDQAGFNNLVFDIDGKARRGLLFWTLDDGKVHQSFALRLSLEYLKRDGITAQAATSHPHYLQLGKAVFRRFEENDGSYIQADDGGYQILANPRGAAGSFVTVSMMDVLEGRIPPTLFRDRVVLIGSTAVSLKDFFYTSYSNLLGSSPQQISGVELQANFVSQILGAALDGRSLIHTWPTLLEWGWIVVWAWVGAQVVWVLRSPHKVAPTLLLGSAGLSGVCYLAFLIGWWLPVIPPTIALVAAAIGITSHLAYLQEELKRSKDFLNSIINTIPDPVFVKDSQHRWIVLNQAYCKFLGDSCLNLLNKSDYDVFPPQRAATFRQQDQQVFDQAQEQESEDVFTNSDGSIRCIATKRSLHKDAAGNLFLVGVMRDITERKRMEEELKRTAAELVRSNAELQQSASHLRHQANHDPLTGLSNRILFQERLDQALDWARENGQLVALLFLDLDDFKLINDTHGHDMGDLLLKAVAHRLMGCLRGSDTISRLGGDEFTIILPAIPSVQDAGKVAEKILETLSNPFEIENRTILVTSSVGISVYPQHGEEAERLVKGADSAMYCAKEFGKNHYEFASP